MAAAEKPGRKRCCILFCGRTFKCTPEELADPEYEVICGKHFRLADRSLRARLSKLLRLYKKAKRKNRKSVGLYIARRYWELWKRILNQVQERAAGITAAEKPIRRRRRASDDPVTPDKW